MKNIIEIKNNRVCKTYSSRMDFVKEENLYKKLQGSGLVPELIDSHDGYLEHEYVQGENFLELINKTNGDSSQLEALFSMFFSWYQKYRELTKLTVGQVRFEKFIVSGSRLCYLDFEQAKPGYMEDDLARLVAQIYLSGTPYSQKNYEMVRFFIYVGAKCVEWNSSLLYDRIRKAVIAESKLLGIPVHEEKMEQVATALTSSGIVFAGGDNALNDIANEFRLLPQRFLSVAKGKGMSGATLNDFVKVQSNTKSINLLERLVDSQKNVNQTWTACITADMPRIPDVLWSALLSADKKDYAAILVEANGKLRDFPMLLNTEKTKLELQSELQKEEKKSLKEILSKMNIKVIKVEDIRA